MIGQVLNGNYRLTDLVGSGGYADVYLARDLRSNTIVAVKILHAHITQDADVAARFAREASLTSRLQTPHAQPDPGHGQDPPSPPYMVMEFVQGLTVAELIRRNGPFPIPEALHIVDQLLSALGSAHALGIVHRDVKPQNMMIDAERRLKVLDFGVARVAGSGTMTSIRPSARDARVHVLQQVEGRPVDHRADLYTGRRGAVSAPVGPPAVPTIRRYRSMGADTAGTDRAAAAAPPVSSGDADGTGGGDRAGDDKRPGPAVPERLRDAAGARGSGRDLTGSGRHRRRRRRSRRRYPHSTA